MQEKIREVAERISEMRHLRSISAEQMAESLGIDLDLYNNYEEGNSDISASLLHDIAGLLSVDMSLLLTGEEPKMHIFTVTRKNKGIGVERKKDYKYQTLAANFIHKKAEPFLVTVEPKQSDKKVIPNSHPGQEFDYVLEGTLKIFIHNNELTLEPGDSIFFDASYEHAMEAVGGKAAKFLAIIL